MASYYSIDLDVNSKRILKSNPKILIKLNEYDTWKLVDNLHVTISYGLSINHPLTNWAWSNSGTQVKFNSMRLYADDKIISVMVGAPSANEYAHITVATRLGAKPKDSNSIDWNESIKFEDLIELSGRITYHP